MQEIGDDVWELLLERHPSDLNPTRTLVDLPVGSWVTPPEFREAMPPGSKIQRRIPTKTFQVQMLHADNSYSHSKTFGWSEEGSPSDGEAFNQALDWAWDEYSKRKAAG